ncbi:MAG: hypothetical protein ACI85Q_001149 [Salibacteraceae bacterium]|jgi:hypothetical protein
MYLNNKTFVMKKFMNLITIAFVIVSFNALSQEETFVGENSELLIGKTATFDPDMGYVDVYEDSTLKFKLFEKKFHTNPKKLLQYSFVIVGVFKSPRINQKGLILKNEELGAVYYSYYTKDSSNFYLIIKRDSTK